MRYVVASIVACIISIGLFIIMFHLIHHDEVAIAQEVPLMVDITQVKAPAVKNKAKEIQEKPVPKVNPLQLPELTTKLDTAIEIDMPDISITDSISHFSVEQKYWSQPGDGSGVGVGVGVGDDSIGKSAEGIRAITPSATRRPNIPKIAYDNRINGWVLLSFTITNAGLVKDIQVLDSHPRGVFEANAVAAVSSWRYPVFKGKEKYISQRIDFEWNMYDYNLKY